VSDEKLWDESPTSRQKNITITQKYENNKNTLKIPNTRKKTKKISKIKNCRLGRKIGENPSLPDLPDHLIPLKTV